MIVRLLLDPAAPAGGGTPTPTPSPTPTPTPAADESFKGLLAKSNNDAVALASMLYEQNHKLRNKNASLRQTQSPEGATVLTGDDAAAWAQYKALGKPDELKTAREERDRLKEESVRLAKGQLHNQAAEAAGFKGPVLSDLLKRDSLDVEIQEVQANGKTVRVAKVKHLDAAGKETLSPLSDYAKAHWADYLPALTNTPAQAPPIGTPPRQPATPFSPPAPTERRRLHGSGSI